VTGPGSRSFPLHQVFVSRLVGGAAIVAMRLVTAARRRGLVCTAWVPGEGPAVAALEREKVPYKLYQWDAMSTQAPSRFVAYARMAAGLVSLPRPVVHVHGTWAFGVLRPALIAARARAIVHFHMAPSPEEIDWVLKWPPTHIVTCARYIADRVSTETRSRGLTLPVTAVPNAVDTDVFRPGDRSTTRARLGLADSDRFVIVMLANLAPHKGQATAIRALSLLHRRGIPAECWLVGEDRAEGGTYLGELQALASSHGLADNVRFLGFRRDVPQLLQAADAFILPSAHEGLPLSVLEAQSAGVPVVGSAIPGIREVVEDGRTGFVVPNDDVESYADRLARIYLEPDVRTHIAGAARASVLEKHGLSVFDDRMFAVYQSIATSN
jgi:glycosyltransferase involved in cell wall biosynthesis